MRQAKIIFKNREAGVLLQHNDGKFEFRYRQEWLDDQSKPAISPTLPKASEPYYSDHLFPFFYNMLPEGANREVACQLNRLDQDDHFGLLMATASHDTIGAVTVIEIEEK